MNIGKFDKLGSIPGGVLVSYSKLFLHINHCSFENNSYRVDYGG